MTIKGKGIRILYKSVLNQKFISLFLGPIFDFGGFSGVRC